MNTMGKVELGLIVTMIITLGGWIFSVGVLYGQIQDNTAEIAQVKVEMLAERETHNEVGERLARIETMVKFMYDDRREQN